MNELLAEVKDAVLAIKLGVVVTWSDWRHMSAIQRAARIAAWDALSRERPSLQSRLAAAAVKIVSD